MKRTLRPDSGKIGYPVKQIKIMVKLKKALSGGRISVPTLQNKKEWDKYIPIIHRIDKNIYISITYFHDKFAYALLIVDASDHLDADLGNAWVVRELEADVLQDLDHALTHTDTRVLYIND